MEWILALAIIGLIVEPVILMKYFTRQNKELHDRLSARSLEEFKYYQEIHPLEVDRLKEAEESRKRKKGELETPTPDQAEQFRRNAAARA